MLKNIPKTELLVNLKNCSLLIEIMHVSSQYPVVGYRKSILVSVYLFEGRYLTRRGQHWKIISPEGDRSFSQ